MLTIEETKDNFKNIMLPFKFKDAIIFANSLAGEAGFYGLKRSGLFFISLDNLETKFKIETPDSLEELMGFTQSVEFIIHRVAVNSKALVAGYDGVPTTEEKIRPFIEFITEYEKTSKIIERIKYGGNENNNH